MTSVSAALDLSVVRFLVGPVEPSVSAYLDLQPLQATRDRDEEVSAHWRDLANQLAAAGADDASIDAVGRHLCGRTLDQTQWAVFASRGELRYARALNGFAGMYLARFGSPPDVVGLLAWLQRRPPVVSVVIDRTGADLTVTPGGGAAGIAATVVGPDDEIERNAPGGWSQARYQRRAMDSWQHNATAVATQVARDLRRVGAELLLLAGDVRARQFLRDHLPVGVRHGVEIREIPGGRRPDGSEAGRRAAIAAAVADFSEQRTARMLDEFASALPPAGLAVEGAAPTLAALAEGRVRTLFVVDDPFDDREAWFGPQLLCAHTRSAVDGQSSWIRAGRLTDVAVRAAVLTDAEVCVLRPDQAEPLGDHIGALCRFAPTAPPPGTPLR